MNASNWSHYQAATVVHRPMNELTSTSTNKPMTPPARKPKVKPSNGSQQSNTPPPVMKQRLSLRGNLAIQQFVQEWGDKDVKLLRKRYIPDERFDLLEALVTQNQKVRALFKNLCFLSLMQM
jgi:hypothetical protein